MARNLIIAAALACLTLPSAAAHETALIRATTAPLPQGHPYLVQRGGVIVVYPVPRRPLQYGIINGQRALVDPLTMRVIYVLHP